MRMEIKNLEAKYHAGLLRRGDWGAGEVVCAMSALVPGAESIDDCVAAGWPKWLVDLIVSQFDQCPDTPSAYQYAHDVATACSKRVNGYDEVRRDFLVAILSEGKCSALTSLRGTKADADWWRDCEAAVLGVVEALRSGGGLTAARAAARDAAWAAARDAARDAARAAAWAAARGAARAAAWAAARDAAWAAAWAAARDAAWSAAGDAAGDAAGAAARDAQRQQLIAALSKGGTNEDRLA